MQVLNKFDKEELVTKMHQDGKTIREIAAAAHVSFGDIGKIIKKIDGLTNDSKDSNDIDLTPFQPAIILASHNDSIYT